MNIIINIKDKIKSWLDCDDWEWELNIMQKKLDAMEADIKQIKKDRELDAASIFLKISKAYYKNGCDEEEK